MERTGFEVGLGENPGSAKHQHVILARHLTLWVSCASYMKQASHTCPTGLVSESNEIMYSGSSEPTLGWCSVHIH